MRYQIKQKFLSLTEKFTVKDEAGRDVLQVEGRLIGSTKTLKDMAGKELAMLKRHYFTLRPTFQVMVQGKIVAVIRRRLFRIIGAAFDIETATGPVQVEGRIFERNYTLRRDGRPIAEISKTWFAMTDTYGVEIFDESDTVITLAMVLAIDSFLDAKDS